MNVWILAVAACAVAGAASAQVLEGPHGDLYLPEKVTAETPKVLAIHGGWRAYDRSSFAGVAEALSARGAIVYNIDYRLTPVAPWPACGDDCLAAAQYLSDYRKGELTDRIFTVGVSDGGHLSLMTGLRFPREKVAGVVSISGITDRSPDDKAHQERYALLLKGVADPDAAFPISLVRKDLPDVLLTHYYFDTVVPVKSPKNFGCSAKSGTGIAVCGMELLREAA